LKYFVIFTQYLLANSGQYPKCNTLNVGNQLKRNLLTPRSFRILETEKGIRVGILRRRLEDNIKVDLKYDLFDLIHDKDRWRAFVNTVLTPQVHTCEEFLG
jgi:hypothetical protein